MLNPLGIAIKSGCFTLFCHVAWIESWVTEQKQVDLDLHGF